jgi:DNA-binding MarR family transcriptional regulator
MNNNLERLIKQKVPIKSPKVKAEIGLIYISYLLNSKQQDFFKEYQITSQQYNVLRILRGQFPNPVNINLIRDRMIDRMSDASRIVDRLQKQGFVTKQTNNIDKRNTDVMISEKALSMLLEIDIKMEHAESLLGHLDDHEIEHLNMLIDKILDNK